VNERRAISLSTSDSGYARRLRLLCCVVPSINITPACTARVQALRTPTESDHPVVRTVSAFACQSHGLLRLIYSAEQILPFTGRTFQ